MSNLAMKTEPHHEGKNKTTTSEGRGHQLRKCYGPEQLSRVVSKLGGDGDKFGDCSCVDSAQMTY